jgi:hypothetical protein
MRLHARGEGEEKGRKWVGSAACWGKKWAENGLGRKEGFYLEFYLNNGAIAYLTLFW